MKKLKQLTSIAFIGTMALVLSACGSAAVTGGQSAKDEDTKEQTVRVAVMTNSVTQWIAEIGDEQDIFEQNGIDIEVTEFAAGINTADAVTLGQADIGYMADYAVVNRIGSVENSNLRILASTQEATQSGSGTKLFVNPEKINQVSDLAGLAFGSVTGTVNDYYMEKTYEFAGISPEDQNIIKVSDFSAAVAAATTGDIDAFWASGTDAQKLEQAGLVPILSLTDLGIYTNAFLIADAEAIKASPEKLANYLKAYQETLDWIYENQDAAADIISEEINVPADVWKAQFAASEYRLQLKQKDVDTIDTLEQWEFNNGNFDNDYEIRDFLNADLLTSVDSDAVDYQ
ncbi:MAG: ABC transporter substrate-binding protein [Lachnospiraceae bacterium]